jgi:hypothetical protein
MGRPFCLYLINPGDRQVCAPNPLQHSTELVQDLAHLDAGDGRDERPDPAQSRSA